MWIAGAPAGIMTEKDAGGWSTRTLALRQRTSSSADDSASGTKIDPSDVIFGV